MWWMQDDWVRKLYTFDKERVVGFIRNMPHHQNKQFDQVIWNCDNSFESYSPRQAQTDAWTGEHTDTQKLEIMMTIFRKQLF